MKIEYNNLYTHFILKFETHGNCVLPAFWPERSQNLITLVTMNAPLGSYLITLLKK
jgi:hypothetical protein